MSKPEPCQIHLEEEGVERPATKTDPEFGPVCSTCYRELRTLDAIDRENARALDAALRY